MKTLNPKPISANQRAAVLCAQGNVVALHETLELTATRPKVSNGVDRASLRPHLEDLIDAEQEKGRPSLRQRGEHPSQTQ